jgi:hypothetical protein
VVSDPRGWSMHVQPAEVPSPGPVPSPATDGGRGGADQEEDDFVRTRRRGHLHTAETPNGTPRGVLVPPVTSSRDGRLR